MKKRILLLIFLNLFLDSDFLFGREIKELSSFTIMGTIELRDKEGLTGKFLYRSLNHEGGMKIKVLEISNRDSINQKTGVWLRVLTTAPMWVDTGDFVSKHSEFWIFLEDDRDIFDYEE